MSNWLYVPPASWPYSEAAYRECVAAYLELEWRRCKQDPWYFIKNYPRTKDQLDQKQPFKHFPDLRYLAILTDLYLTERVVVLAKSRRTIGTWHACAFQLWDFLFYDGRTIGYQNETELKSQEMIAMTDLMYDSLPSWMKARRPIEKSLKRLKCAINHSEIIALPQGADVTRMYTFSRILSDETGTQKFCPENYKGAVQTITGRSTEQGGQLIYIGTAKASWFKLLVHDQLDTEQQPPPVYCRQLIPEAEPPGFVYPKDWDKMAWGRQRWGMEVLRQKTTNYVTVFLHFTADPEKRSEAWKAFARLGIPAQDWAQEMDIDFDAKSGKKALEIFDAWRHKIVIAPFKPPHWWPRWTSHDYGLMSPYSCHAYTMGPDRTVYAYWEHYMPGTLNIHLDAIKEHEDFAVMQDRILDASAWTAWQQSSSATPEGMTSHQVKSIAEMHEDAGVSVIPGSKMVLDAVKIQSYLTHWDETKLKAGQEPTFKIMDNCTKMLEELPGIRWKKPSYAAQQEGQVVEKLVDANNHAFDDGANALLHLATPGIEPVERHMTQEDVQRAWRKQIQEDAYAAAEAETENSQFSDEGYFDDGLD